MSASRVSAVVSTQWLAERLAAANIHILDGSWHLPSANRNQRAEYEEAHIPGAQFFDIDGCSNKSSSLDHMLPESKQFEEYVGEQLGIGKDTHVVVYDNNAKFGLFSAQRVWWTFRVFGHHLVSVVDGGLNKWKAEKRELTKAVEKVNSQPFKAVFNPGLVKNFEDLFSNIEKKKFTVLDARPSPRFQGKAPEPRPGIKPGCMPGAVNTPFMEMLDPDTNTLKSPEQLQQVFEKAGVDLTGPLTASCGSGISACLVALAAYQCGKEDVAIYDGSWTEWYLRAKDEHKINVPTE